MSTMSMPNCMFFSVFIYVWFDGFCEWEGSNVFCSAFPFDNYSRLMNAAGMSCAHVSWKELMMLSFILRLQS